MINDIVGSLFDAPRGSLIGIPVNTVGVAGKGLALYMKKRWPNTKDIYDKACRRGTIATGTLIVNDEEEFKVALLPTKYDWRNPSDPKLIEVTLLRLREYMERNAIDECHIPRIGCGETTGMLSYKTVVRPLIVKTFVDTELTVNVYFNVDITVHPAFEITR